MTKMIENFLSIISHRIADTGFAVLGGSVGFLTVVQRLEDIALWCVAAVVGGMLGYIGKTALEHTIKYFVLPFIERKKNGKTEQTSKSKRSNKEHNSK
jgi:hypothetical protein